MTAIVQFQSVPYRIKITKQTKNEVFIFAHQTPIQQTLKMCCFYMNNAYWGIQSYRHVAAHIIFMVNKHDLHFF